MKSEDAERRCAHGDAGRSASRDPATPGADEDIEREVVFDIQDVSVFYGTSEPSAT